MKQVIILAAMAFLIAGCARVEMGPAYLGMPAISDADAETALPEAEVLPPLKHVTSSKVLGAMAYHKVTGRTIDPTRLEGRP